MRLICAGGYPEVLTIDKPALREGWFEGYLSTVVLRDVTSFAQIVDLVSQTEHLAVLPGLVAHAHAERLSLHPLPFELPRYALYLCCGVRFESDPGIAWMRERLGQIILAQHSVSLAKRDASLPGTEPAAP